MADRLSRYEQTRCYRLGWAFERIGWAAMAVIIAGAVAGVFGGGSLSSVEAAAGDVLAARYPRFARADAPLELEIEWTPPQRSTSLWIARAYLDQFEIDEVRPGPAETTFDRDRIYYTFRATEPNERVQVVFRLRPQHGGRFVGSLGVDADARIELRQLIFP
jgi:protein-L-isoaspartate(D-aspartate) O-methyltransferase